MFNVESEAELVKINQIAQAMGKKIKVALRINPAVKPKTHYYIVTGKEESKFGIPLQIAKRIFLQREKYPFLEIVGIHLHIGSQITEARPFIVAIKKVLPLLSYAAKQGLVLRYFNLGGGLGITYNKEKPQTAEEFSNQVLPLLGNQRLKIILEPGRFIVGNAGVLLTRVLYIKENPGRRFIIVDAGMNDLLRPALYHAYHKIIPLEKSTQKKKNILPADVVGPICESGDFLGKERSLDVKEGDYLAILGSGAYGFSMSSNYNSRPRSAEVLVAGKRVFLIRRRESWHDLVVKELGCLKKKCLR